MEQIHKREYQQQTQLPSMNDTYIYHYLRIYVCRDYIYVCPNFIIYFYTVIRNNNIACAVILSDMLWKTGNHRIQKDVIICQYCHPIT